MNIRSHLSVMIRAVGALAVLAVLLICSGWFLARNVVLKEAIENTLEKKMGLHVYLGEVRSTLFLNRIEIHGVIVENPAPFSRRLFVYLPRVTILSDLPNLFGKDGLHLFLLDFEMEKINIIRNAEGRVNLKDVAGLAEKSPGVGRKISADLMRYDIKDAFFYDEADKQASVRAYPIDAYDLTYSHTDSFEDVVDSVIQEVMAKAKLGETLNFVSSRFFGNIKDLKKVPSKFADTAMKTSGSLFSISRENKTAFENTGNGA